MVVVISKAHSVRIGPSFELAYQWITLAIEFLLVETGNTDKEHGV